MAEGALCPMVRSVAELRTRVTAWRRQGDRIVLVPTMGYLHDGHLSLVRRGRELGERVVATIFVNPTQFGPQEDLDRYPRDETGDLAKLAQAGCDLAFLPTVAEMYPPGFATSIAVSGVAEGLCGAFRPQMFGGVALVVTKLLLQALPDTAIFGEKDYQQLQVIRRFVRDLDIPVAIAGWPTRREADGLAMSSRNSYLTPDQRAQAPALFAALTQVAAQLQAGVDAAPLLEAARERLLAAGFSKVDYLEFRDADTLAPLPRATRPGRVLAAAWIGRTRLIDNVPVAVA